MPDRDRRRQKTTKNAPARSKPSVRKSHFEAESWYAEAARKLSAVKRTG
jgi:hypothetical protein